MISTGLALSLVLLAAPPGPASVEIPSGIQVDSAGRSSPASTSGAGRGEKQKANPGEIALEIGEVTVFSDRARIVRRGEVTLGTGEKRVSLPSLPATLDPGSIRLEARGATVRLVEVRRARHDELPRGDAERLLRELERASDEARALQDQKRVLDEELQLVQGLRPRSTPQPSPELSPVLLEPAGWPGATSFFDARAAAAASEILAIEARMRAHARLVQQLVQQVALLVGGGAGEPGYVLEATLEGRGGPARLELVYMVGGARWLPAYDVRHTPGKPEVEVHFAGLVSQATGEDWTEARLVLSTAVPSTTTALPKLASWKIGDRDQFIPRPQAKPRPQPARPPPPPPRLAEAETGDAQLRQALQQALAQVGAQAGAGLVDTRVIGDQFGDVAIAGNLGRSERQKMKRSAPPPRPQSRSQPSMPPSAPMAEEREYEAEEMLAEAESMPVSARNMVLQGSSDRRGAPGAQVGFGAPRGWRAPSYSSELPAALAGGYDYTFSSARPETVRTGGEERRVALHASRLPAKMLVTVMPALAKQAYLVADVTNTADRPLLRGRANLYVGADLQGQAQLKTTAVGEKVSLPLGVDEAIGVERNVNVLTGEKGVFSKDDVTRYEVVIELLNPRSAPLDARIVDQVPIAGNQHVKVQLEKMDPWAIHDEAEGTLEWRIPLAPREKRTLRFVFTITRPHDAKLRQW